uniref:hypothetical protein n=1 Tax=Wolbachia endosymbiont of Ctenocephalides felis wCfeT TaxID=2732593 RepID=UPI0014461B23|nr:hypothetical protein [Wolbachia endosymbiont of Ctenocephalides felis wCfeT]
MVSNSKMKVIFHIVYNFNNNIKPEESIKPEKNTKFVVHFFGMGGFIKVNVLGKNKKKSSESDKQENGIEANVLGENEKKSSEYDEEKNGFKRVDYYFDYPFFSDIVNPEHFCKELRSREKKFTGTIVPLCLLVLSVLAFTLVILLALAVIFFAVSAVWLLFDFIKERFVVHRLENLLEGLDPELVKLYKNQLIGKQSNEGVHGQKPEKSEDIKDIVNFLLKGDKVLALYKFLTNGEKLVQAGMAMVNKLLLEGVHPNDIILDTNSLGGGIAAEVLKRFAELGIYLTLIHSNSYCTLKDASNNFPHVGKLFTKQLPTKFVNVWFRRCGLEWDQQKVIEKDVKESPVMVAGRDGDTVIPPEKAQLADIGFQV